MEKFRVWWFERRRRPVRARRTANVLLVVGAVVALGLVVVAVRASSGDDTAPDTAGPSGPATDATSSPGSSSSPSSPSSTDTADPVTTLTDQIQQAVASTSYPDLEPPVRKLGIQSWLGAAERHGCVNVTPSTVADCVLGDPKAEGLAVVLGDDAAIGYLPAVRAALPAKFRVQQLTLRGCPVWDVPVDVPGSAGQAYPQCSEFRAAAAAEIARLKPDLLFVSSSYDDAGFLSSGAADASAVDEVQTGYEKSLAALTGSARFTVVLPPPPGGASLQDCQTPGGDPDECERPLQPIYQAFAPMERSVAAASNALLVDTFPWFCSTAQQCPSFVGDTPVYADGLRLTREYALKLGPLLEAELDRFAQEQLPGS